MKKLNTSGGTPEQPIAQLYWDHIWLLEYWKKLNPGDSELLLICQSAERAVEKSRQFSEGSSCVCSATTACLWKFKTFPTKYVLAHIYTAYNFINPGWGAWRISEPTIISNE